MPIKYFSLNISAADYQAHYRGVGHVVVTRTDDGQRLQFPAMELRKFVSYTGVYGRFEITFDKDNKLKKLVKLH